ncbi:cuticle protein CP1499-like [Macrobrachium rosenbergii]|uniref:cuticle protein CP1499-like n=1 Tax=Macrobrachium rosenbergii TaxID=79674 RepID=UPI0034D5F1F1
MRALVVLAVVGFSSAFIQDAPDVAAEKARFMASFQAAQQAAATAQRNVIPTHQAYSNQGHYQPHHQGQYQPKWTGPVAATVPAGVNGAITPVGDTADVNAARQAFFSAYQNQLAATAGAPGHQSGQWQPAPAHHGGSQYQPKWTGPVAATVPAGLPGSSPNVADTPEVQAAKANFFQTFQRQAAAAAPPAPAWG